jgi:hypothetical protein
MHAVMYIWVVLDVWMHSPLPFFFNFVRSKLNIRHKYMYNHDSYMLACKCAQVLRHAVSNSMFWTHIVCKYKKV